MIDLQLKIVVKVNVNQEVWDVSKIKDYLVLNFDKKREIV